MHDCLPFQLAAKRRCAFARKWLVMTGGRAALAAAPLRCCCASAWIGPSSCGLGPRRLVDELKALPGAGERLAIVDADLASLGSVGQACEEVARLLGGCRIDALALNAGIQTVGGAKCRPMAWSSASR